MTRLSRFTSAAVFAVLLLLGVAAAQHNSAEHPQSGSGTAAKPHETGAQPQQAESPGQELTEASERAAGEHEENAEFKQSSSVRFLARITGLSLHAAYWLAVALNFAVIAAAVIWFSRTKLPGMFRARKEAIRRTMEEAQRASAEADRRLKEVESRLARLDSEVSAMRAQAEGDAAGEEQRILAAAEGEARHIVESAAQEVEAAARLGQRELKAYAAELAISLAEKRIRVDATTDRALVETFVAQLPRDGNQGGK